MDRDRKPNHPDADWLEAEDLGEITGSVDEQHQRNDMRVFLVACHMASVSVDTMAMHLGLDSETIRTELMLGIDAWNAPQRRTNEFAFGPHLKVA
jgi:hypothetical protein